jgi:hypothetical protein
MCSSFIQNMSCRPRTTVYSKGLTPSKVPHRLKGEKIFIDPGAHIPDCMKNYARKNPDMCVPVYNALLALGNRRSREAYMRFIDSQTDHEKSLMKQVARVPEEIAQLPGVGFIKKPGTCDGLNSALAVRSLRAALFVMARSNRFVYIRNKSPLLSLITARRVQVIFASRRRR